MERRLKQSMASASTPSFARASHGSSTSRAAHARGVRAGLGQAERPTVSSAEWTLVGRDPPPNHARLRYSPPPRSLRQGVMLSAIRPVGAQQCDTRALLRRSVRWRYRTPTPSLPYALHPCMTALWYASLDTYTCVAAVAICRFAPVLCHLILSSQPYQGRVRRRSSMTHDLQGANAPSELLAAIPSGLLGVLAAGSI
jgi:hypothetical protein